MSVKRSDLVKYFEKHGYALLREGANHSIYSNGVKTIPIKRHRVNRSHYCQRHLQTSGPDSQILIPLDAPLNPTVIGPGVTPTLTVSTLGLAIISGTDSVLTNQSYFTLLLSITPGTHGPLSVSFEVAKGGSSDPRGYFLRSSLDGFATAVFSETLPAGANHAPAPSNFQLNAACLTSASMRFYLFTPDPTNNSVDFRSRYLLTTSAGYVIKVAYA